MIRPATLDDIPRIIDDLLWTFHHESDMSGITTFSPEAAAERMGYIIASKWVFLVAEEEGRLVGLISFSIEPRDTVELLAFMDKLYVHPSWRGTPTGRDLLKAGISGCQQAGAVRIYASSAAGFRDDGKTDRILLNLYKKFGFEELGCFVRKDFS